MDRIKGKTSEVGERPLSLYENYIHLDILLHLQNSKENQLHPDDLTFQVVHQTFELWWKTVIQLLERACEQLNARCIEQASRLIYRSVEAQMLVIQVMRQLEFISPADFLTLRAGLGDASGASSPGFRAIKRAAPVLWQAFSQALEHEHLALLDLYLHPDEHMALYTCAEMLIDFDEQLQLFRAAHFKLATRYLGPHAIGTGGSSISMLERTQNDTFFPQLWEVRGQLLVHMEQQSTVERGRPADGQ
jgi:tryptophan 2,3-dioxygenase